MTTILGKKWNIKFLIFPVFHSVYCFTEIFCIFQYKLNENKLLPCAENACLLFQ